MDQSKGNLRDAGDSTEALEVSAKDAGKSVPLPVPRFPQHQSRAIFSLPTAGEIGAAWALLFPLGLGFLSAQHFREAGPCHS